MLGTKEAFLQVGVMAHLIPLPQSELLHTTVTFSGLGLRSLDINQHNSFRVVVTLHLGNLQPNCSHINHCDN